MGYSFFSHLLNIIKKYKVLLIVFTISFIGCLACSFLGALPTLLTLPIVLVLGIVIIVLMCVKEFIGFYKSVKNNRLLPPKTAYSLSLVSIFLCVTLIVTMIFACFAMLLRTTTNTTVEEYDYTQDPYYLSLPEDQRSDFDELLEASDNSMRAFTEKGYTSVYPYLAVYCALIISLLLTITEWHTALSFAARLPMHPVLTMFMALFGIGFVNNVIVSLLSFLMRYSAPGITAAIGEINTFLNTPITNNSAELLNYMADNLPSAETFVKVIIISGLCSVVAVIADIFISFKVLNKKQQQ